MPTKLGVTCDEIEINPVVIREPGDDEYAVFTLRKISNVMLHFSRWSRLIADDSTFARVYQ